MNAVLRFSLALLAGLTFAFSAAAQTRSCALVEQLAFELGCSISASGSQNTNTAPNDFVLTSSYGPSQCKTGAALKDATNELKSECQDWLKDRKKDLKEKYQTGTCNEECSECGSGLRKCNVKGVVHYAK